MLLFFFFYSFPVFVFLEISDFNQWTNSLFRPQWDSRAAQTARPFSHRFFRFLCFFVFIIFHLSRIAIIICSLTHFNDLAKVPFVWLIRQSEIKLIPPPFFSPSSFCLHPSAFRNLPPSAFIFFHPSALRLHFFIAVSIPHTVSLFIRKFFLFQQIAFIPCQPSRLEDF